MVKLTALPFICYYVKGGEVRMSVRTPDEPYSSRRNGLKLMRCSGQGPWVLIIARWLAVG